MLVTVPDEYDVSFDDDEIRTLKDAIAVLGTILGEMRDKNCDTLEGDGWSDFPVQFHKDELFDIKSELEAFCTDVPNKMIKRRK